MFTPGIDSLSRGDIMPVFPLLQLFSVFPENPTMTSSTRPIFSQWNSPSSTPKASYFHLLKMYKFLYKMNLFTYKARDHWGLKERKKQYLRGWSTCKPVFEWSVDNNMFPLTFAAPGEQLHLPEPHLSCIKAMTVPAWSGDGEEQTQHWKLSTYIRLGVPRFPCSCSIKSSVIIIFWSWLLRQDIQTVKDSCHVSQHKASTVQQRRPLVQLPRSLRLTYLSILLYVPIVGSSGIWW